MGLRPARVQIPSPASGLPRIKIRGDVEMATNEQTAAMCVARVFQGYGHRIDGREREIDDKISEFEKAILKDLYDFFLALIEHRDKVKLDRRGQVVDSYTDREMEDTK